MLIAVHIVPAISKESSGPSYSVPNLARSLLSNGVDCNLVAMDLYSACEYPPWIRLFPKGSGPIKLGCCPSMNRWLRMQARTGVIDILHNHGMWQVNSLYIGRISRPGLVRLSSPRGALSKWAMAHGSRFKKMFWYTLQKPCLRKMDCLHATCLEELGDIRRLGFSQPVTVIPNGIDLPSETLVKKVKKENILLFLGRIHPVKGVDNLLKAWAIIEHTFPKWKLVIAGSDHGYHEGAGYMASMIQLMHDLKIRNAEFVGEVTGERKKTSYLNADLFVLPTHSENFGVAAAEALAHSVPAIVTKGAPWSGLIENKAGWHIDIGVEPLVVALREAMAMTHQRRVEMGKNGRDWMKRDFSWTRIGQMMAQTYHWLLRPSELEKPSWVHNYHS